MLEDDVASNKAIGSYGASVLQHLLKDSKRLSILTHCNTGRYFSFFLSSSFCYYHINKITLSRLVQHFSDYIVSFYFSSLATAGYGTALGVIRAVHTEGFLERAYCTETRPFNQVIV